MPDSDIRIDYVVTIGETRYFFDTYENAEAFKRCVEQGGLPEKCAKMHHCIDIEFVPEPPAPPVPPRQK